MATRYMDAKEAGKYLGGVAPATLTKWARAGEIPAIPMGEGARKMWRFTESGLDEWMRQREIGASSPPPK